VSLAAVLLLAACAPRIYAPESHDGRPFSLHVLVDFDRETGLDEVSRAQVREVIGWMEGDLLSMLRDAGYDPVAVNTEKIESRHDRHLLHVTIYRYDPGDPEARAVTGFGEGACSLDITFRLTGPDGVMVENRVFESSSRDWPYAAGAADRTIAIEISEAFAVLLDQTHRK